MSSRKELDQLEEIHQLEDESTKVEGGSTIDVAGHDSFNSVTSTEDENENENEHEHEHEHEHEDEDEGVDEIVDGIVDDDEEKTPSLPKWVPWTGWTS